MKTIDKVQKTILRIAAVVLSFVLLSYTVSAQVRAQGFWKRFLANSSFGHLASVLVETDAAAPEVLSLYADTTADADWELEAWMMDENHFVEELDGVAGNSGIVAGEVRIEVEDNGSGASPVKTKW